MSLFSPARCRRTSMSAVISALLGAFLLAGYACIVPQTSYAAVSSVQTADTETNYRNPATNEIEDSGGEENEALGSSMCRGVVSEKALVETDTDGNVYLSVRLKQADQISNLTVESDQGKNNQYSQPEKAVEGPHNATDNTADWRVKIASADANLRFKMHVDAMGRDVVYFVNLTNLQDGNSANFAAQVTPGQGSPDNDGKQSGAADKADKSKKASEKSSDDTEEGISEYDAEGKEVTGAESTQPLDLNYPLVIAIAVGVIAVVAAAVYFAVIRPKRAKQHQAMLEAAGGDFSGDQDADTDASAENASADASDEHKAE